VAPGAPLVQAASARLKASVVSRTDGAYGAALKAV
jgi:hypothetical protein